MQAEPCATPKNYYDDTSSSLYAGRYLTSYVAKGKMQKVDTSKKKKKDEEVKYAKTKL